MERWPTEQLIVAVTALVEEGIPIHTACGSYGFQRHEVDRWLLWGRQADPSQEPGRSCVAFSEAVVRARSKWEIEALRRVTKLMTASPKGTLDYLKILNPDTYAPSPIVKTDPIGQAAAPPPPSRLSAREQLARIELALPELRRRALEEDKKTLSEASRALPESTHEEEDDEGPDGG